MHEKIWFIDTVVLSNFAFADQVKWLESRYGLNLKITGEVYQETLKGFNSGYSKLSSILEHIENKKFGTVELSPLEKKQCYALNQTLGLGEASCIAAASHRKGIVITDDRTARQFCQEKSINFTGTIGILKASCLDGSISLKEADMALKTMISFGFYSPVARISDIL